MSTFAELNTLVARVGDLRRKLDQGTEASPVFGPGLTPFVTSGWLADANHRLYDLPDDTTGVRWHMGGNTGDVVECLACIDDDPDDRPEMVGTLLTGPIDCEVH